MADVTVDRLGREVLLANTAQLAVDGVAREVLLANTGKLVVDQVVREVLITTAIFVQTARQYAVSVVS
jgi:hypothetical protein